MWLFNTAAKLLKYLPSYGLQTHTFKDAKFQTVLQNGFKDFTVHPKSWKKKIARENNSLDVKRERGNGLHVGSAGDGSLPRVTLFLNEAMFQG